MDVDVDVDERAIARGAPRCERGECHSLLDMAADTAILGSIFITSRAGHGLVPGVIVQQARIGLMHMHMTRHDMLHPHASVHTSFALYIPPDSAFVATEFELLRTALLPWKSVLLMVMSPSELQIAPPWSVVANVDW